ncbi:MAG: hypothetical protein JXR59_02620 [Desulfuromonadaceae bacterium]|nr:hypothetical protein [Desulfuromonadaceae bacterium]
MKKDVLFRYERDAQGRILIDVTAEKVEELFSNFDRNAPYIRRDLDPDLVDYLIDSAREVDAEPFVISFSLASPPDRDQISRIRSSVTNFFQYLIEVERQNIREMIRRSLVLLCLGITLLFFSVWLNQWLGAERSVIANVFAEGLTIAAWVSMWEALAVFLADGLYHVQQIRLYRRLVAADTVFRSVTSPMPQRPE